jgi:hypothetical protein
MLLFQRKENSTLSTLDPMLSCSCVGNPLQPQVAQQLVPLPRLWGRKTLISSTKLSYYPGLHQSGRLVFLLSKKHKVFQPRKINTLQANIPEHYAFVQMPT